MKIIYTETSETREGSMEELLAYEKGLVPLEMEGSPSDLGGVLEELLASQKNPEVPEMKDMDLNNLPWMTEMPANREEEEPKVVYYLGRPCIQGLNESPSKLFSGGKSLLTWNRKGDVSYVRGDGSLNALKHYKMNPLTIMTYARQLKEAGIPQFSQ